MFKFALAFTAGNLLLQQSAQLTGKNLYSILAGAMVSLSILFILGYFCRSYQRKQQYISIILLIVFFCAGYGYSFYYAQNRLKHQLPDHLQSRELIVTGKVDSLIQKKSRRLKFDFQIHQLIKPSIATKAIKNQRIRLSWYYPTDAQPPDIAAGEIWQLKVKLKKPSGFLNPAGRDYEKWLFAQQIIATGYVRKGAENRRLAAAHALNIHKLRSEIASRLDKILVDNPYKGIYKAVILGIKDDITTQQWQLLIETGTNHLMAISGLHISLFALLGYALGSLLWRIFIPWCENIPVNIIAAWVALIFALCYAALSGFAIPAQRALLMIAVFLTTIIGRIHLANTQILAIALLLLLLFDPLASLSPGFWLSFAAVGIILFFLSPHDSYQYHRADSGGPADTHPVVEATMAQKLQAAITAILSYLRQLVFLQVLLFIGLIPITLLFFGQFYLYAPLANFIAVPLMSLFIIPAALLASLFLFLYEPAAIAIFQLDTWLLKSLWPVLQWLREQPLNIIQFQLDNHVLLLIITILMLLTGIWFRYKRHLLNYYFLSFTLISMLSATTLLYFYADEKFPPLTEGDLYISVLDVGQGLSVLIQTQHHSLLYDTGNRFSDNFDLSRLVVLPYLQYRAIEQLDMLILSHADHDHVGSAGTLLEKIKVKNILSGEPRRLYNKFGIYARPCLRGQRWQWDGVNFEILAPEHVEAFRKSNNNSCVLHIDNGKQAFLLTGDIEKPVERFLLSKNISAHQILVAGHHGSRSSSTEAFVKKISPEYVIFTNGYKNRYQLPHRQVVNRYRSIASHMLSTENGMIEIYLGHEQDKVLIHEYRKDSRHYWNRVYNKPWF